MVRSVGDADSANNNSGGCFSCCGGKDKKPKKKSDMLPKPDTSIQKKEAVHERFGASILSPEGIAIRAGGGAYHGEELPRLKLPTILETGALCV